MSRFAALSAVCAATAILAGCGQQSDIAEPVAPASRVETAQPETPPLPEFPEAKLEDVDFAAYSTELGQYVGLTLGETRLESTDKIRLYFAPEPGTRIIKTASQTFERDDGAVLLFSRVGLPDDSVKAQEIYAVFSGPGGDVKFNQTLAAYGMRIKCHRGENTTEWQTDLCP